jgi:ubiquinone biosynthesis protein UbiJ
VSIDKDELARMALDRATKGGHALKTPQQEIADAQLQARIEAEVWTVMSGPAGEVRAAFRNAVIAGFAGDGMKQLTQAIADAVNAETGAIVRSRLQEELAPHKAHMLAIEAKIDNLHARMVRLQKRLGPAKQEDS